MHYPGCSYEHAHTMILALSVEHMANGNTEVGMEIVNDFFNSSFSTFKELTGKKKL